MEYHKWPGGNEQGATDHCFFLCEDWRALSETKKGSVQSKQNNFSCKTYLSWSVELLTIWHNGCSKFTWAQERSGPVHGRGNNPKWVCAKTPSWLCCISQERRRGSIVLDLLCSHSSVSSAVCSCYRLSPVVTGFSPSLGKPKCPLPHKQGKHQIPTAGERKEKQAEHPWVLTAPEKSQGAGGCCLEMLCPGDTSGRVNRSRPHGLPPFQPPTKFPPAGATGGPQSVDKEVCILVERGCKVRST